jgi:hypothetical protein
MTPALIEQLGVIHHGGDLGSEFNEEIQVPLVKRTLVFGPV